MRAATRATRRPAPGWQTISRMVHRAPSRGALQTPERSVDARSIRLTADGSGYHGLTQPPVPMVCWASMRSVLRYRVGGGPACAVMRVDPASRAATPVNCWAVRFCVGGAWARASQRALELAVQTRGSVHRLPSAAARAVRDVAAQNSHGEEALGIIDLGIQVGFRIARQRPGAPRQRVPRFERVAFALAELGVAGDLPALVPCRDASSDALPRAWTTCRRPDR